MIQKTAEAFRSFDHDDFLRARSFRDGSGVVMWPTVLHGQEFIEQCRVVLGPGIARGKGVVRLAKTATAGTVQTLEDNDDLGDISVDKAGNLVTSFTAEATLKMYNDDPCRRSRAAYKKADFGYGIGYGEGYLEKRAKAILKVVDDVPDRIKLVRVWNRQRDVGWLGENRTYTSIPMATGALLLRRPNRDVIDQMLSATASGDTAVYKAVLNEFAATIPILRSV